MYAYQKDNLYFAQIENSIKELGAQELSGLGAAKVRRSFGGIYFSADKETLYRINYSTRLVSRILAPLVSFDCENTDQLYDKARRIRWTDFITPKNTFAIFSNLSNSKITNSHFASLRFKDGIVDAFRDKFGERPSIDTRNPDIWLNLYIRNDQAVISLDTSGGSLHRRGYRKDAVSAPMQEIVAAAIIKYAQWDGPNPLYDPLCGSGTILSEALLHYCRIPSGYFREHFGFEFLPDFDPARWKKVKQELKQQIRALPEGYIGGSDISAKAIEISKGNIGNLPSGEKIQLDVTDFKKIKRLKNRVIITNPPYGIRMGKWEELDRFYETLGDFLKRKCKGSTAYVYFGEREFIKKIGLRPAWKKPLKTGGLDGRLVRYDLF